jgi:hypothetical protein
MIKFKQVKPNQFKGECGPFNLKITMPKNLSQEQIQARINAMDNRFERILRSKGNIKFWKFKQ